MAWWQPFGDCPAQLYRQLYCQLYRQLYRTSKKMEVAEIFLVSVW